MKFLLFKPSPKRLLLSSFLLFSLATLAQEKTKDTTQVNQLDEVLVSAIRVTSKTPVSFSNLSKKEIQNRNLGQDIPILMN
jgi:iron complex outermembrane receptor protein